MGFPYDNGGTWTDVSGPIFMGAGGAAPGMFALIGIVVCIVALAVGQRAEATKYSKHK
ncbi:MAG: hypothetical protein AAFP98_04360 [Pseudomonadota bacterium]